MTTTSRPGSKKPKETDDLRKLILPINEKLSLEIYDEICRAQIALRQTVVRASDFASVIGLPDDRQIQCMMQTAVEVTEAFAEATQRIKYYTKGRDKVDTDLPPSTDNLDRLNRELNKPHKRLPTPETVQLNPLDRQEESERIDVTRTE